MKVKTYHALTMPDAIRAIKEELGSDAVILSTKRIRKGGPLFGLFGRTMIEVIAAIEPDQRSSALSRRRSASQPGARPPARPHDDIPEDFRHALQASIEGAAHHGRVDAAQHDSSFGVGAPPPIQKSLPVRRDDASAPPEPGSASQDANGEPPREVDSPQSHIAWNRMRAELRDLRDLLVQFAGHKHGSWMEGISPRLREWAYDLLRIGLDPQTVQQLLAEVQQRTPAPQLDSETTVRRVLHHTLSRHVLVGGPLLAGSQRKKAVLFLGPTGAGKTTTIAKLAAHYRLKERRRVSLITMDTYRVTAVEQLRTYASVIGVTMDVALTRQEALDCLRRRHQADLILIDTAGRSPSDRDSTDEVEQLATADHPLEVHLVLSATTRDRDLVDAVARYAGVPIARLLFTKLDETQFVGGPFELMRRTRLPLSYFSIGQRVPEDLEVVTPEHMADRLLAAAARIQSVDQTLPTPRDSGSELAAQPEDTTHHLSSQGRTPEWIPQW